MVFDEATTKRFWEKVERRGPDECWPWKGIKSHSGYGLFRTYPSRKPPINHVASRTALALTTGSDIPGRFCLHACDNKPCCNPNHLRWGTQKENNREAFERICGRREKQQRMIRSVIASGKPARALAKLSPQQVCSVRKMLSAGLSRYAIARKMGVSDMTIHRIRLGRTKIYRTAI